MNGSTGVALFSALGIIELHHFAFAVLDLSAGKKHYASLGFVEEFSEDLPEHGVSVSFMSLGGTRIELLAPLTSTREQSRGSAKLLRFLERRGEGFHHLCYRVQDLGRAVEQARSLGLQPLESEIAIGAGGSKVAFFPPASFRGVLTELCELPQR